MLLSLGVAAVCCLALVGCGTGRHSPLVARELAQARADADCSSALPDDVACGYYARIERWYRAGTISASHVRGAIDFVGAIGCHFCHVYRGLGTELGAPDLTHIGRRMDAATIARLLNCPACVQPHFRGAPKPLFKALVTFLAASR